MTRNNLIKRIVLISLFAYFSGSSVFAAESPCSPKDLNLNDPLKSMPMINDHGAGISGAFAAMQLLDFELRKSGTPRSISAVDLAALTKETDKIQDVIEAALKTGVASKECIEKAIRDFTRDTGQTQEQFVALLDYVHGNTSFFGSKSEETRVIRDHLKMNDALATCSVDSTIDLLLRMNLLGDATEDVLKKVLNPCTSERTPINCRTCRQLKYESWDWGTDGTMQAHLDDILNRDEPAGLSICSELVSGEPNNRGILLRVPGGFDIAKNCSTEDLLAIGRRSVNGKCQYLLRNSIGMNWGASAISCACKAPDGRYFPDCNQFLSEMSAKEEHVAELMKLPSGAESHTLISLMREQISLTDQTKQRVMLGCWVDSDRLVTHIRAIGGFTK